MKIVSLKCKNCGGDLHLKEDNIATCPFCGTAYHVKKEDSGTIIHHTTINHYENRSERKELPLKKSRSPLPLLIVLFILIPSLFSLVFFSSASSIKEEHEEKTQTIPGKSESTDTMVLDKADDLLNISTFKGIKYLIISDAQGFEDYSLFTTLPNLLSLSIHQADKLKDLNFVKHMNQLEHLSITGSQITDLSPLKNKLSLLSLELKDNPIHDYSVIETLTSLTTLKLSPITEEETPDLSGLSLLETKEFNQ